jgi:hypothetical protein
MSPFGGVSAGFEKVKAIFAAFIAGTIEVEARRFKWLDWHPGMAEVDCVRWELSRR